MDRKIVVVLPQLKERHREQIRETAKRCGFQVCFADSRENAIPEMKNAEIMFGQVPSLIAEGGELKWVCTPSAGVDAFLKEGIIPNEATVLTNSAGAYGTTISEHVVMQALILMRQEKAYREIVARREWRRDLPVRSIHGSRIVILGTGDLGTNCALRFRGFGPAGIIGLNRSGHEADGFDEVFRISELDRVLPETDLLVITLPGTRETEKLLNRERLLAMPADSYLINVGRGCCVDQTALEEIMRAGHLAGAALDVFEEEPLSPDSSLWDCPRVWITPHTAGNMTLEYTLDRIVDLFLENLEIYASGGTMKRIVNRTLGY